MKIKGNLKDLKFAEQVLKNEHTIPENMGVVDFTCSGGERNEFAEKIKKEINGKYMIPKNIWEFIDKSPSGKKYEIIEEL